MYGLLKTKGTIVHVADNLYGLNKRSDHIGRSVYDIVRKQRHQGLNSIVVISSFKSVADKMRLPAQTTASYFRYDVDEIPVFMLRPKPGDRGAIKKEDKYQHFQRAFWHLLDSPLMKNNIALIHGHGNIFIPILIGTPEHLFDIKTLFSPYSFGTRGLMRNTRFGMLLADANTIWTFGDLKTAMNGAHSKFYQHALSEKPFFLLSNSPKASSEKMENIVSDEVMTNLYEAYLQTIYSTGYDFSFNVLKNRYSSFAALINLTEYSNQRGAMKGPAVAKELKSSLNTDHVIPVVRGKGIGEMGYRGNFGGILQMLGELSRKKASSDNFPNTFFAVLAGGRGERMSIVNLASGGVKGQIRILDRTLNEIAVKQGEILAQQLPSFGRGWTILSACDNIMIPYGPITIGQNFLQNAKQKFVIFSKRIKARGSHRSDVNYLRNLLVLLADSKNGSLREAYFQKRDPDNGEFDLEYILSRLNAVGGDDIYKATYYYAMTNDLAEEMHRTYSVPSKRDGKPLHETYALNFEKNFFEALAMSKQAWMKRYSIRNVEDGMLITDLFHIDDWEYLWDAANKIKKLANGIGIAGLDEETVWADVGTLKEFTRVLFEVVRHRRDSMPIRKILGLEESIDVINSYINNVALPPPEETAEGLANTYFIKHSVFKNGGKIGRNCVIVNSVFEEPVNIPDNTIIIGSHIYSSRCPELDYRQEKLIYMYHPGTENALNFQGGLAQSTVYVSDNKTIFHGSIPIRIDVDVAKITRNKMYAMDQALGHYVLDGNVSKQNIEGIGKSFDELKKQVNIERSNSIYQTLNKYIDRLLKQLNK